MPKTGEIRRGSEIGKSRYIKFIWDICAGCGKGRWVLLSNFKKGIRRQCNRCAQIGKQLGDKNPNWRGGRVIGAGGYVRIYVSLDDFFRPMATVAGYIREHRLVMAQHLNRCLLPWEIVHHKNGARDDNRLENLELLPTKKYHIVDSLSKSLIQGLWSENKKLRLRIKQLEAINAY